MKQKIFVAGVWGFGNRSIMDQFSDDDTVEFLKYDFTYFHQMAKVWKFIRHRLGGRGASILRWLLKTKIFDGKYALSHCDYAANDKNYVVIFNSALLQYYSREYFLRLKRKNPNIKYILYIIDPMPDGLWPEIKDTIDVFDDVMTIHPYNCRRYGFQYLPYIYAKPGDTEPVSAIEKTNLFFCGVSGDHRQAIISEIVSQCEKNRIAFDFWLKPYGNNAIDNTHVHYGEMSYTENVQRLKQADCILEIMHEGFEGITQRYLEAIIYNKKLLTNNAEIMQLPYYDPRYMHYFKSVADIEWDWLQDTQKVDYQYKGDFSPEAWKHNLLQMMEAEEKRLERDAEADQ